MKQQAGFSLIIAIFILVILSLLGTYMVNLSAVQQTTSVYALQGARAYQTAKAGIEWSIAIIHSGASCSDINSAAALNFTGLDGFSVTLSCSQETYTENVNNLIVYKIKAVAGYGAYTSNDYVSRSIEISIVN